VISRPAWWCTCCWRGACSPSWDTRRSGAGSQPAWRGLLVCAVGPTSSGETAYAADLTRSLRAGMLLLADRNFGSGPLARKIAAAEADFLIRVRTGNSAPKLPVLRRLPDGSWLSAFGGVPVRVIDAAWTVTTGAGRFTSDCRLITTLTDPARYPACDLAVLYHERWEAETAHLELKSTILGGRVLRARTPDGVEQEAWALLVAYQALRTAIADAASTVPGADPDRASFTIALNTARDQVTLAAGVIAGTRVDLAGRIGRLVLASLMPPRRLRISPRVVKRAISKYNARGKVDRETYRATIDIAILTTDLPPDDGP
jgi:hypothetical protein